MTVTHHLSTRLTVWLVVAGTGLLAGVLLRRIDLMLLAAPFAVVPVLGLVDRRELDLGLTSTVTRARTVEGDEVRVQVEVAAPNGIGRLELGLLLPGGLVPSGPRRVAVLLRPGERRVVELVARAERWGTYGIGGVTARVRDRSGMRTWVIETAPVDVVRVHPSPETIQTLVRPRETQLAEGAQVSRDRGSGIEPADLRAFAPGDSLRDVNWRATARRGELWANERHPERTTDVIVFVDALADPDVVRAVRAAITLTSVYLRDHDRVGLVSFGGSISWVYPGSGRAQQVRMVDHLLGTTVWDTAVWRDLALVPPGTLPPRSLVVAVSPLEDARALAALADLRDRSIDLAVVELVPELSEPLTASPGDDLARRLWALRRDEVRSQLRRSGVPVVKWPEGRSVESVLAEMRALRRRGRLVHR